MKQKMKKSTKKIISVELFLIFVFLLNIFVLNIKNIFVISSFLILNILIVIYLLGYEKTRQRLRKDALLIALIFSILSQVILYLSGIFLGFLNNGYSMTILGIIKNALPVVLLIITTELLRYCINQKGSESKLALIISCITFIIIESSINTMLYNIQDKKVIIEIICLIILPTITKNILLTYSTTKFGYTPSVVYRLITELPLYFIPIIPNISDYLTAVIKFLYPIIVLIYIKKTIGDTPFEKEVVIKEESKIPILLTIIFVAILVTLNSGLAPLYILAIGSGSMEETFYRGDAVIVKKMNKKEMNELKEDDILVYKYQNKVIVHRIYKIEKKDNDIQIITKGDNNNTPDSWEISDEHIIGKTVFMIKYIGFPTIWLNDLLN